jgi:hypothetical protein
VILRQPMRVWGTFKCFIKHRSLLARDPETANESIGTFQCAINIESGLWTNIGTCHLIKTLILQWKVGLDFFSLYISRFTRSTVHSQYNIGMTNLTYFEEELNK